MIIKEEQNYKPIQWSMFLGSIVTFAILYSPQTLIQIFSETYEISPSLASLPVSIATFTLAITMLFVAVFSDAYGRKQIMVWSLLLASILNVLLAFSPNFYVLVGMRAIQGIVLGGFPAIAMTYLSEEIKGNDLGRIMGIYVAGSAFGAFVGRIVVSSISDLFSWHVAVVIMGLLCLFMGLYFTRNLPKPRNFERRALSFTNWYSGMKIALFNKKLLLVYGMGFLLLGVYVALFNYISFPLSKDPFNMSQTFIGLLFVFQLTGTWGSYLFGRLSEKYQRAPLILLALLLAFAGALFTLSSHLIVIMLGLMLFATGFLASHSIASGWVGLIVDSHWKAYASSLYLLFYYTGSSVLGTMGGTFLEGNGWHGVIVMVSVTLLLVALFAISLNFQSKKHD
ncbi:MFS transporter [Viridibacillus arvi]|uniref:MFS transporter n=1 Tax=Viridibacillus arvi TaxID=263475 RepID=UPI003D2AB1C2